MKADGRHPPVQPCHLLCGLLASPCLHRWQSLITILHYSQLFSPNGPCLVVKHTPVQFFDVVQGKSDHLSLSSSIFSLGLDFQALERQLPCQVERHC
jgi:hypothetical protein